MSGQVLTLQPGSGGSVGSDSLVVTRSAPVGGNVAISVLGVIDWYLNNGLAGAPRMSTNVHAKARGGPIMMGFDWVLNGGTVFSQANGDAVTWTSILPDDRYTVALTNANTGSGVFVTAGAKYGWMLSAIPASKLMRHLVIYAESFSCDTELIVTLNGQVATTSTTVYNGVVSARRGDIFTIDFAAPQGGDLCLSYLLKNILGASQGPNVKFNYAYIF